MIFNILTSVGPESPKSTDSGTPRSVGPETPKKGIAPALNAIKFMGQSPRQTPLEEWKDDELDETIKKRQDVLNTKLDGLFEQLANETQNLSKVTPVLNTSKKEELNSVGSSTLTIEAWVDNVVEKGKTKRAEQEKQLALSQLTQTHRHFSQEELPVPPLGLPLAARILCFFSTPAQNAIDSFVRLIHKNHSFVELGSETNKRLTQKLQEQHPQTEIKQNDMNAAMTELSDGLKEMNALESQIAENLNKVPSFLRPIVHFLMESIRKDEGKISSTVASANEAFSFLEKQKNQLDHQQETLKKALEEKLSKNGIETTPVKNASVSIPIVLASPVATPAPVKAAPKLPANDTTTSLTTQLMSHYATLIPLVSRLQEPHLPNEQRVVAELAKIHLAKEEIELTAARIMANTHTLDNKAQTQTLQLLLQTAFDKAPEYVQESIRKLNTLEPGQRTLHVFMKLLLNKVHADFEALKQQEGVKIEGLSSKLKQGIADQKMLTGKR